jgi:hypothetical protein
MIPLSPETRQRLEAVFREEDQEAAAKMLEEDCGSTLPLPDRSPGFWDRIRFAVLKLSAGDLQKLKQEIEGANCDWRDTLMAAGFGHDATEHLRRHPRQRGC